MQKVMNLEEYMPTERPRITITLSGQQHEVLRRMSLLGGESMSSIVVDMLDTVMPMLERVVVTMQAAHDAPAQAKKGMRESFARAEAEMLPQLTSMMHQLDMLLEPAPAPALAGAGVGSKSTRKPRPPTSNRGVRKHQTPVENPAVSPMKTARVRKGAGK
jgi:hypothetical protein